jgi:hypothetical protein
MRKRAWLPCDAVTFADIGASTDLLVMLGDRVVR